MALGIAQLSAAMAGGDSAAVDAFYREYFDWMYGQARRITGRDESFCLDVVQDAVLRVIRTVRAVDSEVRFRSWLRLVVQTTAFDLLRNERRRKNREAMAGVADVGVESDALQLDWLAGQISTLDPEIVRIIELRFEQRWTLRRIGETLGISVGAVDGRLRRALSDLRLSADQDDGWVPPVAVVARETNGDAGIAVSEGSSTIAAAPALAIVVTSGVSVPLAPDFAEVWPPAERDATEMDSVRQDVDASQENSVELEPPADESPTVAATPASSIVAADALAEPVFPAEESSVAATHASTEPAEAIIVAQETGPVVSRAIETVVQPASYSAAARSVLAVRTEAPTIVLSENNNVEVEDIEVDLTRLDDEAGAYDDKL